MARLIMAMYVLSVGSWLSLLTSQQLAADQPAHVLNDMIGIGDFGLESQIPSAIDLVGPEHGPAGRNRAALVHGLQCWIDGIESCSVADRNDPRVRAIRRYLSQGPVDQAGAVVVHFPDQTRVEVTLRRETDLDPADWEQRVYEPVVLAESVQVPGLSAIPSTLDDFEGFEYDGTTAIRDALARFRTRLEE